MACSALRTYDTYWWWNAFRQSIVLHALKPNASYPGLNFPKNYQKRHLVHTIHIFYQEIKYSPHHSLFLYYCLHKQKPNFCHLVDVAWHLLIFKITFVYLVHANSNFLLFLKIIKTRPCSKLFGLLFISSSVLVILSLT